jgi:hypothetical protein
MDIPIIVVCYNNYLYVKNTLEQILKINPEYYKNINILNNNSTCLDTLKFLNDVDVKIINNKENTGPWVDTLRNRHIYDTLPNKFILTDPDLKFNENISSNFIEILSRLSDFYGVEKIGFALKISDFENFYSGVYHMNETIADWEKQFWRFPIINDTYEMYNAMIDTTFCLCNKNFANGTCIRVAGNFTAQHLPWYVDNDICNLYENYSYCLKSGQISTMSNVIMSHIKHNYFIILKNCETFLIENDKFLSFWKNPDLIENKVFDLIDEYLFKDKIIIDIGSMTGIAAMFGSRKSKHAYIIETDEESFTIMSRNFKNNCRNYTLINNNILNYDDIESILKIYKIDFFDVSLIKINIGGEEENILNELLDINVKYGLKIYISIYYVLWKDKNLNRFTLLDSYIKNEIISNPLYLSILL